MAECLSTNNPIDLNEKKCECQESIGVVDAAGACLPKINRDDVLCTDSLQCQAEVPNSNCQASNDPEKPEFVCGCVDSFVDVETGSSIRCLEVLIFIY